MNDQEELRSIAEQIRAQVKAKPENKDKDDDEIDEMILDVYLKSYTDGEISKGDLEAMANAMGYEFTEEFANDEQAVEDFKEEEKPAEGEGGEGMSKETLENTRTMEEGESKEDFKEKIEDAKEGKEVEGEEETETETESEDDNSEEVEDEDEFENEDEEKKKASELWKMKF